MESNKSKKAQVVKIVLLLLSLLIIPFVSTSMRPYFLFNLLIIVLGIDSGILSTFSDSDEEKKPVVVVDAAPLSVVAAAALPDIDCGSGGCNNMNSKTREDGSVEQPVEKKAPAVVEKMVTTVAARVHKLRRCPSVPSLFFIGSCDGEGEMMEGDMEGEVEEGGELTGPELFARAETFISNFYKQLKIQREESWKKIHGIYHKAF